MVMYERFSIGGNPWARNLLIGLNCLVFFLQLFAYNTVIYWLALWPSDILNGQFLWTIVTSMFVHADIGHIFFNMYALFIFGDDVEHYFGHRGFLINYLFWGIFANLFYIAVTAFFTPFWLDIPTIGASGAIFGVMIAYAIAFPCREITIFFPIPFRMTARTFVILYVLLETGYLMITPFSGMVGGGVAHAAHIGGAIAGFLSARRMENRRQTFYREPIVYEFK